MSLKYRQHRQKEGGQGHKPSASTSTLYSLFTTLALNANKHKPANAKKEARFSDSQFEPV
jgi:hypothetical protein